LDKLTPKRRSENMRRIRSKGMKPEMAVRRIVHKMGYRFRLHGRDLPGQPDLVFPSRLKVVFVHGCFWHQHPSRSCKIVRLPKSNLRYWKPKLARNVERDYHNQAELRVLGWQVLTVWECSLKNEQYLAKRLGEFLNHSERRPRTMKTVTKRIQDLAQRKGKP
jgi:DNA mismatch endonuclease (patch repair protein)